MKGEQVDTWMLGASSKKRGLFLIHTNTKRNQQHCFPPVGLYLGLCLFSSETNLCHFSLQVADAIFECFYMKNFPAMKNNIGVEVIAQLVSFYLHGDC